MDLVRSLITAFTKGLLDEGFADDVFFDLNVPQWRYQLKGREAVEAHLREEMTSDADLLDHRATTTDDLVVVEMTLRDPGSGEISREAALAHLDGDGIATVVVYCTGMWDEELVARHAAEAPMIDSGYIGGAR